MLHIIEICLKLASILLDLTVCQGSSISWFINSQYKKIRYLYKTKPQISGKRSFRGKQNYSFFSL